MLPPPFLSSLVSRLNNKNRELFKRDPISGSLSVKIKSTSFSGKLVTVVGVSHVGQSTNNQATKTLSLIHQLIRTQSFDCLLTEGGHPPFEYFEANKPINSTHLEALKSASSLNKDEMILSRHLATKKGVEYIYCIEPKHETEKAQLKYLIESDLSSFVPFSDHKPLTQLLIDQDLNYTNVTHSFYILRKIQPVLNKYSINSFDELTLYLEKEFNGKFTTHDISVAISMGSQFIPDFDNLFARTKTDQVNFSNSFCAPERCFKSPTLFNRINSLLNSKLRERVWIENIKNVPGNRVLIIVGAGHFESINKTLGT